MRSKKTAEPTAPVESRMDFGWWPSRVAEAQAYLWSPQGEAALLYLREKRRLTDEAIRHFKLGAYDLQAGGRVVRRYIVIPINDAGGEDVNLKFRSIDDGEVCGWCQGVVCQHCLKERAVKDEAGRPQKDERGNVVKVLVSKGVNLRDYRGVADCPLPLFGQLGDDLGAQVIVVEGELDVISLWIYGFQINVVTGTAGAGTLKDGWLDQLEPYPHFVLAYDPDKAGDKGADRFAKAMGEERCSRATLPGKDANDCLVRGISGDVIERALTKARSLVGLNFRSLGDYADEIEELIKNPRQLIGMGTGSSRLDQIVGGLPDGLVVITGDTGAGKTSFTTWLCRNLALQGYPGVVTSFEQRPRGTVQKFLRMQLQGDFTTVTEEARREAFARMDEMPVEVLDHYGNIGVDLLRKSIKFSHRRYGIRWFLVDHLGFLVDSSKDDERRQIDAIVRELALLGVNLGVCIILVCHPTTAGTKNNRRVMLADLKGASSIQQDAHLGIVVEKVNATEQRPWAAARIHADKVRSEFGLSGASRILAYDHVACLYADQVESLPRGRPKAIEKDPTPKAQTESKGGRRRINRPPSMFEGSPSEPEPEG